jgi:hypothetical protein
MADVVVVIPGITGSVLARDGDVWALSASAIASGLFSVGRSLRRLKLPEGIGDDEPDDRVVATGLMPDLHVLPGVWSNAQVEGGRPHRASRLRTAAHRW